MTMCTDNLADGAPFSGCLHSPAGASVEKGKLVVECVVNGIVAAITEKLKQKQSLR